MIPRKNNTRSIYDLASITNFGTLHDNELEEEIKCIGCYL